MTDWCVFYVFWRSDFVDNLLLSRASLSHLLSFSFDFLGTDFIVSLALINLFLGSLKEDFPQQRCVFTQCLQCSIWQLVWFQLMTFFFAPPIFWIEEWLPSLLGFFDYRSRSLVLQIEVIVDGIHFYLLIIVFISFDDSAPVARDLFSTASAALLTLHDCIGLRLYKIRVISQIHHFIIGWRAHDTLNWHFKTANKI